MRNNHPVNIKEADPYDRQCDLLYGAEAEKMFARIPRKKGANFCQNLVEILFETNIDNVIV